MKRLPNIKWESEWVLIALECQLFRSDCGGHMNMECFGVSVITDMGDEENIEEVNHEEVLQAAQKAEPHVRNLIKNLIALVLVKYLVTTL